MEYLKTSKLEAEPSRKDGRLIDEWTFTAAKPGPGKERLEVKIKVNLVSEDGKLLFRAHIPDLGKIEDSDIQKLRERVEEVTERYSIDKMGVVWEDWLKVTVNDGSHGGCANDFTAGLNIRVEPIKRGIDPQTGNAYIFGGNGHWSIPMDHPSVLGLSGDGHFESEVAGKIVLDGHKTVGLVPATPENLEALQDLAQKMGSLRDRLMGVLAHQEIQATLERLAETLPALAYNDETSRKARP